LLGNWTLEVVLKVLDETNNLQKPNPPCPPSLQGKGGFKASPRFEERFTRGVCLYIKNLFIHPLRVILYNAKTSIAVDKNGLCFFSSSIIRVSKY
jgi:hypothetical protein